VLCPNPFYQIYEGATLLAGARPYFVNSLAANDLRPDWSSIPKDVWAKTRLAITCSPGNPHGRVMGLDEWKLLFELSDRHGFLIAADECYSEIYFDEARAPLGALAAAAALGREGFPRLVSLSSLSKRSSAPGLRSGFVAGDRDLLKAFLLYRTYHGSAVGGLVQAASIAAWNDEAHVQANRALYRDKFAQVLPLLEPVLDVALPDASFYLWAGLGPQAAAAAPDEAADIAWARGLLAQYNVAVLPGSLLAREVQGHNPGRGRIRMALVAPVAECLEAARRIVSYTESLR
jgi:N-succinyldiaminopimelate aminotransferase